MTKKFKPTLIPTLFTIPAFIILVILGTWQLQRLQWKNEVVETFKEETAKADITWPVTDWSEDTLQYRRVTVTGSFLHEHEIFLYANYKGKPGYDIITPFSTENGSTVLVNRGWIPMDRRHEAFHNPIETTIQGIFIKNTKQGMFTPDNNPSKNVWFWVDTQKIERLINIDLPPYTIRAIGTNEPDTYPLKANTDIKFRNDHMQYAIIWYSFAIALLIIYYVYHRRPEHTHVK